MNDIEHTNRHVNQSDHSLDKNERKRRTQRQKTSPSPEPRPPPSASNQLASLDLHQSTLTSTNKTNHVAPQTASSTGTTTSKSGAGNSNSLPGHQSGRSNLNNSRLFDQQALNVSDNLNSSNAAGDDSQPSSLARKKNLSTSDLDPSERKKQAALTKVEAKLEKAQRLHQKAQQSVEQEISEFLRVTTIPNTTNETGSSSRTTSASFDKRIKTLQDTKRELEKKIVGYQTDMSRIQAGDIPHNYSSSKDILSNIKSTAAKVTGGSLKHRSSNHYDPMNTISTVNPLEHLPSSHHPLETDNHHHHNTTSSTTSATPTTTTSTNVERGGAGTVPQNQHNNTVEAMHSSLSSSTSNEISNSQFYLDPNHEYIYEHDKSNRRFDPNALPADGSTSHDNDKSPSLNRRPFDDSSVEFNDRVSDHSVDDRHSNAASKRQTSTTGTEYQQLSIKVDFMQKLVDRYEFKINEMQKQMDSLISINENQRENNERLNNELTDLIDLHQIEVSSIKTDLKNLEQRLVYKFNDYWNELLEKLDKLDTRTAKVEQTQTHSLETEENTHRIISKLVNIVLTVFAIILLLLSTIKNLVQSRVHAMTLLILIIIWITLHYLPQNYFQTSIFKNFSNMFKRTSSNNVSP